MTKKIKSLNITGLPVLGTLQVDFTPDMNIMYGCSGAGKTLILHILALVITGNHANLATFEFETITVSFYDTTVLTINAASLPKHKGYKIVTPLPVYKGDKTEIKAKIARIQNIEVLAVIQRFLRYCKVSFLVSNSVKDSITNLLQQCDRFSDGMNRMIFLVCEVYENKQDVILLDDVDIGIHIDWQYKILSALQKLAEGKQFIVATHSSNVGFEFPDECIIDL